MAVYVNRTLNLKRIKYIGLDMDHTLVRYDSERFEGLAYKFTLERLVSHLKYPRSILKLEFDYHRAVRGLIIDKAGGNLLKISCFGATRMGYHGLQPINLDEQKDLFSKKYVDLGDSQFDPVDTTFSISFATLFAQLVDLKDRGEAKGLPSYSQLAEDINETLDQAHNDGTLKNIVSQNLEKFIIKDKKVVEGIERFVKHGKKIFIITNSDYAYTKTLLDYTVNPFLKGHNEWTDLFEYVITNSQKPRFFYDEFPFLKVDLQTKTMTNLREPLQPGLYQGGCASMFTKDLNLNPNEVLYIGDHIYADVLRLKKDCSWRTGLIVEEIQNEVAMNQKAAHVNSEISKLREKELSREIWLDDLISKQIEGDHSVNQAQVDQLHKDLDEIKREMSPLVQKQKEFFNLYWGEIMRVGVEESYFAYQVERFACVYMGKLADFFSQSPRSHFRSTKRLLTHDLSS